MTHALWFFWFPFAPQPVVRTTVLEMICSTRCLFVGYGFGLERDVFQLRDLPCCVSIECVFLTPLTVRTKENILPRPGCLFPVNRPSLPSDPSPRATPFPTPVCFPAFRAGDRSGIARRGYQTVSSVDAVVGRWNRIRIPHLDG